MSAAGLPLNPSDALSMSDGIGRGRLRRAAPLAALSARTAGEAALVGLRSKLTGADSTEFHVRTAESYTELLGRSKGALMKAGQMLSFVSAGPAVPLEFQSTYQVALARLREDAPPMAGELAQTVLERELGRRALSAFAEFDWEPLAAASIGQVHAASLKDGRAVAVKLQYPGVADAIRADLKNTQLLVTFLTLLGGLYTHRLNADVRDAARDMSARIVEELDYRLEAANQAGFAAHYRGHPFIHVPEVIGELSTDRVLTQEAPRGPIMERGPRRRTGAPRPVGRGDLALRVRLVRPPRHDQRRSAPRQLPVPRRRERELPRLWLRTALPSRADRNGQDDPAGVRAR